MILLFDFCRVVTGIVFLISSISKLKAISTFELTVQEFQILPVKYVKASAWLFIGGEIAVVVLINFDRWLLQIGFALAILLLIIFNAALLSVIKRKIATSCNCFGYKNKLISPYDVWRNTIFILCAFGGQSISVYTLDSFVGSSALGLGLVVFLAVGFVCIVMNLGEIIQVFK
jgi:hypothetical protein